MESVDAIRICQDDLTGHDRLIADPPGTSYVVNEYVSNPKVKGSVTNINKTQETSRLLMVAEGSEQRDFPGSALEHFHASVWYTPVKIMNNQVMDYMLAELNIDRHLESANYLYGDGHVETYSKLTIESWVDQDIQSWKPLGMVTGKNFAKPVIDGTISSYY
jgi:prepilin-type processing-associated H-X9-DG protein